MSAGPVDVLVVGGGPAGAATAAYLARAGHEVLIVERAPAWHWRAGGVFASPAAMRELRRAGLDGPDPRSRRPADPRDARRVAARDGVPPHVRRRGAAARRPSGSTGPRSTRRCSTSPLAAGATSGAAPPCAACRSARARTGTPASRSRAMRETLEASVIVGADGPRSIVATAAGVVRDPALPDRIGLTWHVADVAGDPPTEARMVVLGDGAYCGIAPVPGGRVNIGIVLAGTAWRRRLSVDGAAATAETLLRSVPPLPGGRGGVASGSPRPTPSPARARSGSRVSRRAGAGWLVVGDAAGFLDPFTGEGLHRALVSARLASSAIDAYLRGGPGATASRPYERAMRRPVREQGPRLAPRPRRSSAQPPLFERVARRLAERDDIRATMGLVMGDLVPASRALDPRFLAGLLAP